MSKDEITKQQSPVGEAIGENAVLVMALKDLVANLEKKLQPVLLPKKETAGEGKPETMACGCVIYESIASNNRKLESDRDALADIIVRLQV